MRFNLRYKKTFSANKLWLQKVAKMKDVKKLCNKITVFSKQPRNIFGGGNLWEAIT